MNTRKVHRLTNQTCSVEVRRCAIITILYLCGFLSNFVRDWTTTAIAAPATAAAAVVRWRWQRSTISERQEPLRHKRSEAILVEPLQMRRVVKGVKRAQERVQSSELVQFNDGAATTAATVTATNIAAATSGILTRGAMSRQRWWRSSMQTFEK